MTSEQCICTRECDCEAPNGLSGELKEITSQISSLNLGYVVVLSSNECPVHNLKPDPNPECMAEVHWFDV